MYKCKLQPLLVKLIDKCQSCVVDCSEIKTDIAQWEFSGNFVNLEDIFV